nr:unnamed protein product [Spirometra erinaceieuropaei]
MLRQLQLRRSGHPVGIDECLSERIPFQHIHSQHCEHGSTPSKTPPAPSANVPLLILTRTAAAAATTAAAVGHTPDASTGVAELAIIIPA